MNYESFQCAVQTLMLSNNVDGRCLLPRVFRTSQYLPPVYKTYATSEKARIVRLSRRVFTAKLSTFVRAGRRVHTRARARIRSTLHMKEYLNNYH